jgi:hypothetical protein
MSFLYKLLLSTEAGRHLISIIADDRLKSAAMTGGSRKPNFGSPNVHWIKVSVNPEGLNLFSFEPMMVRSN